MASAMTDTLGGLLPPLSALESAARLRGLATQDKASRAWPLAESLSTLSARALKPLCRKGVPSSLRPTAWLWLSGGAAKCAAAPEGYYRNLCSSTSNLEEYIVFSVEQEVQAGFHNHKLIASIKGSEALNRMLLALFQHLSPSASSHSYSKGLAPVAALLLIVFGLEREEEAFWTLAALIQDRLFPFTGAEVAFSGRVEQGLLSALVQRKMPHVSAHLSTLGISLDALTAGWFSSAFATVLPPETTVRVWDAVMCEGSKVPQRVALALIKRYEAVILSGSQEELMRRVMCLRASRTFDAEELMQTAFNGVGSMSSSGLAKLRRTVFERLMEQGAGANGVAAGGSAAAVAWQYQYYAAAPASGSSSSSSTESSRTLARSRTTNGTTATSSAAGAAAAGRKLASRSMDDATSHKRRMGGQA